MTYRRLITSAAAVIAAVIATLVVLSVSRSSAAPPAQSTLDSAHLRAIARSWAAVTGEPRPTLIEHVHAVNRRTAVQVSSGDRVPLGQASYLIVLRGQFTAANFPRPQLQNTQVPTGTVLTLVVDATTGHVTDWGLGNRVPNLAKLGAIHTDLHRP